MKTRTATIDGIEMRWEEHGTGTPVVLVHDIPTSPASTCQQQSKTDPQQQLKSDPLFLGLIH